MWSARAACATCKEPVTLVLMSVTHDPWIGQTIDGRYVVRRLIGKGGMGAVYEAEQPSLSRKVAIKVLLKRDAAYAARFRREARLASKVVHEHIAQVYDVGATPDGHDYLVMEYVDGTDLLTVIRDAGLLTIERAVALTREILDGLAAIHALGIVHRDIKPSNVLLTRNSEGQEVVKLGDFGLARAHDDATLTKTGNIVGTTPFMAPEIFRGQAIDHRADLYAVGITLYQMLAGKLPFLGATAEIGAQHVWSPPPPLGEQRTGIPEWLVAIVERSLAKSPADRFQSARAFATALETQDAGVAPAVDSTPTVVERPRPASKRRWPFVLAAIAVIGGGAIGAYLPRPETARPSAGTAPRDASPTVDAMPLVVDAAVAVDAALVPSSTDAGVPVKVSAPTTKRLCDCMAVSGDNSPLCAKQGKPLCRCIAKGMPPLCTDALIPCDFDDRVIIERSGVRYQDVCSFDTPRRCSNLVYLRHAKPGTHGAACDGFATNLDGFPLQKVGEPTKGAWDCDSCPGAKSRVYPGAEGDACTGYDVRTGAATQGTLRHCE